MDWFRQLDYISRPSHLLTIGSPADETTRNRHKTICGAVLSLLHFGLVVMAFILIYGRIGDSLYEYRHVKDVVFSNADM